MNCELFALTYFRHLQKQAASYKRRGWLEPSIGYERGDYEGQAMSYGAVVYGLKAKYFSPKLIVRAEYQSGTRHYDAKHPDFAETREDRGDGMFAMLIIPEIFRSDKLSLVGGAGFGRLNSNITFFDSGKDFYFAGVRYDFK